MSVSLKFAVVREDPALESRLIQHIPSPAVLTVASGGCTALSLLARHPSLSVTAFDLNPAQIAHVRTKLRAARAGDLRALNVDDDARTGLNQRGEFEGLFRTLRGFLDEFVFMPGECARYFNNPAVAPALATRWTAHRYWPVAFALALHTDLLHTMFGPSATQHAEPGSYPGYFRQAFARGLLREDGPKNPFLQHVLLGRYVSAPDYAATPPSADPTLLEGTLLDVPDLGRFDLISLSNIFDWSDDDLVARWAAHLSEHAKPGARVLIRQLNNARDVRRHFGPRFSFDDELGRELVNADRSLFYNRIEVAVAS